MGTTDPFAVRVPLDRLLCAAVVVDTAGVIVAANDRFERLCVETDATAAGHRLAEMVAARNRPAVECTLSALGDGRRRVHRRRRRLLVLRAKAPAIWIAIDLVRLGPAATFPIVACLRALHARRQHDLPDDMSHALQAAGPRLSMTGLRRELSGPVTAIRRWVRLAESGALPPDLAGRALIGIDRHAQALSELIDGLTAPAPAALVNRHLLDLNVVVELAVEATREAAACRGVSLTVGSSHQRLPVDGDPHSLRVVVTNLLTNALAFTASGGSVHISTRADGTSVRLVVSDTGIRRDSHDPPLGHMGAADEAPPAGEQAQAANLSLVRELVDLHGGEVRVRTGMGDRSRTVIVSLPRVAVRFGSPR